MSDENFFSSQLWQSILTRGFGASTATPTTPEPRRDDVPWTVFRKGPFSVAYPRFPVGLVGGDPFDRDVLSDHIRRLSRQRIDLLRLSAPIEVVPAQLALPRGLVLMESRIDNLTQWTEDRLAPNVRYELRRASREGAWMRDAAAHDGDLLFDFYAASVARQRGQTRYTRCYFAALCEAAAHDDRISIGIVDTKENDPCGFVVVAHDRGTSYYLHGGYGDGSARLRPGYLSLAWGIRSAQTRGNAHFNLLTSPAAQPELRKFKEKWGAHSSARMHWDIPLSWRGNLLDKILRVRSRLSGTGRK